MSGVGDCMQISSDEIRHNLMRATRRSEAVSSKDSLVKTNEKSNIYIIDHKEIHQS